MAKKIKKVVLLEKTTKNKENGVENPAPVFVPIQIKQMDFEYFLRNTEKRFSDCVKNIREIYEDRFGLPGRSVELATTDEKLALVNEFLIKFGFPPLSPEDADIAYHDGGDEVFFQEKLEPVFAGLEPELW